MMDLVLTRIVSLLMAAILVAMIARRLRLPYTVGLVAAGVALTLGRFDVGVVLTHDFIFNIILPPLLFEAALSIHWHELRRDMMPILVLSTFGVVISAVVVAAGIVWLLGWPATSALVFGVLIAATDPIAVIAMFKDTGIKGRLRLLVESESLLNDGVAAVLFALVLGWVHAADTVPMTGLTMLGHLITIAGGGIAIGLVCGCVAIVIAGRTSDHLVETTLTAVAAYGSFLLADRVHVSGVLATVSAGLLMGNLGLLAADKNVLSEQGRSFVIDFWEFAAFIANSIIFLMIGLTVARIPFANFGVSALGVIIALVLLARALTVYPLCLLFAGSTRAVSWRDQHVLWWGGLRGALALALALALPPSLRFHDQILVAAFGVVAFSAGLQGLTMPLLLKKLGFYAEDPTG